MDAGRVEQGMPSYDAKPIFPFEIKLDELFVPHDGQGDCVINGQVTHLGAEAIAVGGQSEGSLNLGYRVLKAGVADALFEDRFQLSVSWIGPGESVRFHARLALADVADVSVQVDFVYEGEFWFREVTGIKPFEQALLRSVPLDAVVEVVRLPRAGGLEPRGGRLAGGGLVQRPAADLVTRCVFDLSDLFQFWRHNIQPTGIQRVQIEVVRAILLGHVDSELLAVPFVAVCLGVGVPGWMQLSDGALAKQIAMSSEPGVEKDDWLALLGKTLAMATPYVPRPGDALINLGSSWWIPDYLHKVQQLRVQGGIRYIPFVHDTIPLTVPEYCSPGLVDEFRMWFRGAAAFADHIIVNSRSSAGDVATWARELTGDCCAISVAPLNAAFTRPAVTSRTDILARHNLDIDRYVLCVGTLEGRKNHALLFQVWSELLRQLPEGRLPKLVLVGKRGWMFETASAVLERNLALGEQVVMLSGISDQELSEIYEHCLFTVYPSFYEGWGLPITEAVSYGKLTVASNTSSIPEAASGGDILLDPKDAQAWSKTLAALMRDDDLLERATAASAERAELRTWADVANDILVSAVGCTRRATCGDSPLIQDGLIYDFRIGTAMLHYERSAYPFRSGPGWHHLEDWGAWSAAGVTELKFRTETSEARYLYLVVRGGIEAAELTGSINGKVKLRRQIAAVERAIFRLDLPEQAAGEHSIRMVVQNLVDLRVKTEGADNRKVGIGFINMMCCMKSDVLSRLSFNESMQMYFV
jgi:glycosyltransferase involved in cell wall biosynthesis